MRQRFRYAIMRVALWVAYDFLRLSVTFTDYEEG